VSTLTLDNAGMTCAATALLSVCVVTNATWLARWRPKLQTIAKAD